MKLIRWWPALLVALASLPANADAELVLSQVVVDLEADEPAREDIEAFNDGNERLYVAVDPFLIENPGTENQVRIPAGNPQEFGLLVTPQKLVLEPGERRLIRVAVISGRPSQDKVYRLSIRPVAGDLTSTSDALKVFVGYDALVIFRPTTITGELRSSRIGQRLVISNRSNTSQELFEGRQCDESGGNCVALPAKRLYPGAIWEQDIPYTTEVTYKVAIGQSLTSLTL